MTDSGVRRPAILVEGLSKVYPHASVGTLFPTLGRLRSGRSVAGTPALDKVDFCLAPGEALGVVGRNGSGKSTLLQLLAGALRPTAGTLEIQGRLGTLLDLTAGINSEYTGAENALVLGMLAGLSRREVAERMGEIRAFSGLGEAFDRVVKTYSSGMTMRLGFSAAIHCDPDVLLIDEALAVGDAFYQQRCLRKMRQLRDEGVTIVLVSHDPSAVISLCDRAIWLEQGRIAEMGTAKDVVRLYLAARYRDDCELDGTPEAVAALDGPAEETIAAAAPIARVDERFGDRRAHVIGFELRDRQGASLATVRPGEPVEVVLSIHAETELQAPLIGFTLRNRLGDVVTATNTELEGIRLAPLSAGKSANVAFRFEWPAFCSGPISLSPAVADGCIAAHAMCDWVENALMVECENERGLFGWMTLEGVGVAGDIGLNAVAMAPVSTDHESPEKPSRGAAQGLQKENVPDRIEFALDEPRDARVDPASVTNRRELFFRGWSFSVSGDPVEVAIRVDGAEERVVTTDDFRDDVARVHAEVRHASRSGFSAMVPLPNRAGPTRCRVEVRTPTTSHVTADFELDLPPGSVCSEGAVAVPPERAQPRSEVPARLLFITHTLNLEGAPRSLFEMAAGLPCEEFEVQVVAPADGPLGAAWVAAGFDKRILPVDVRVAGRDDYDALVRRLAGLLSAERPDLIVANTLETFWAVHVAQELGIGSVWIVRESEDPAVYFHSRLPTRIAERGEDALAVADHVVFVAEATRAFFRSKLRSDRSSVIPNGLDLGMFDHISVSDASDAVRAAARVNANAPLLLCVGNPCTRKGQLELLDALALLRDRDVAFHCVFLGMTEGDYLERMRSLIDQSGLSSMVDLLPPTHEPLPYFAAADMLICPSFQESLPRVVLEAMAFAVPIVATKVFGVPELVRDGEEGRLVDAGDVFGMVEAMEELIRNPERARELGRRARKRAEDRFTLSECVKGYSAVFRDVLMTATNRAG